MFVGCKLLSHNTRRSTVNIYRKSYLKSGDIIAESVHIYVDGGLSVNARYKAQISKQSLENTCRAYNFRKVIVDICIVRNNFWISIAIYTISNVIRFFNA